MPKCDIPVRVDALFLFQSLCMWQSMWLHCVCKVWASHLRRGLRSHHSIVDFFLGLLGSRFSVIGSRKSKSECIFGIYARCTFQNTRNFFLGFLCGVFQWNPLAPTWFLKNRDLLWEFRVGEFLAKIKICTVRCSNACVMIVLLIPFVLWENSSKIMRTCLSGWSAFQISRSCSTSAVHTLRVSLVPYSHYNPWCILCNSGVLDRM